MTKCYISLPIKGKDIEEQRYLAEQYEETFNKYGIETVNPLKNGLPVDSLDSDHMRCDYHLLTECDAILMCKGWEYSHGCMNELQVAADCRMKVVYDHQPWNKVIRELRGEK